MGPHQDLRLIWSSLGAMELEGSVNMWAPVGQEKGADATSASSSPASPHSHSPS